MGQIERLQASDGHTLDAYRAAPSGQVLGTVVLGRARELRARIDYDEIMLDVAAAITTAHTFGGVGIVRILRRRLRRVARCVPARCRCSSLHYPSDIGKQFQERRRAARC